MAVRLAPYMPALVIVVVGGALLAKGVSDSAVLPLLVCLGIVVTGAAVAYGARRDNDPFSLLPLIAIFYLLGFVAGAVYFHYAGREQGFTFNEATLNAGLAMGLLGFAGLLLGYVTNPLRRAVALAPRFPVLRRNVSPLRIVVPLLALGWTARAMQLAKGLYFHDAPQGEIAANTGATAIVQTVAALPTVAVALIGAAAYLGRFERRQAFFQRAFWALTIVEALWYFPTGERGQVLGVALMALIVAFYAGGRRIPWKLLVVTGILVTFVLFPFIQTYRGSFGEQHVYQREPGQSLKIALESMTSRSLGENFEAGLDSVFSRFNDVASVATILHKGREVMGLAPGETLRWTVEASVPRFVYPQKEDPGRFHNRFGRTYDILEDWNFHTSIATTQPGELYLNFGWLGVILGMPIVGALYRAINDFLAARWSDPAALAVYSVITWPLIYGLESIIVLGVVGALKLLLISTVLIWVLGRLSWSLPVARRPARA
jgi:hypothetical protein